MVRKNKLWSAIALAGVVAGYSSVSLAQDTPVSTVDNDTVGGDRIVLEEIIVTARKQVESLQDTPLAITAFSSDMIKANAIRDIVDVANLTAGFSFSDEFGRSASDRPVIRGQSTILGASGVSTFVNDVLITGNILDYDLNDAERIEIIKGPQAALYGRNTYSGAIVITTKAPQDEMSGNIKLDLATFEQRGGLDQMDLSASIRGPLTESISGSLTGRKFSRKGPFDNEYDSSEVGDQESQSVSTALYFDITDDLEIRTRLRWSNLHDDQPYLSASNPDDNNCGGAYVDNGGTYLGNERYTCGAIEFTGINVDDVRLLGERGYDDVETWEGSVTAEYAINDEWTLTSITGYIATETESAAKFGMETLSLPPFAFNITPDAVAGFNIYALAGPVSDFGAVSEGESEDISTELRLQYDGDTWSGLVGAYYFNSQTKSDGRRTAPAALDEMMEESYLFNQARMQAVCPTCTQFPAGFLGHTALADMVFQASRTEFESELENVAIFGRLGHDFTDRFNVAVEVRFASETIENETLRRFDEYQYGVGAIGTVEDPVVKRDTTFRSINPRLTASYVMTDDVNIYAVIATGNKPGGFNSIDLISIGQDTYDQETVLSYELGAKATLFDGRMTFNTALYHNTIKDYQLTDSVVALGRITSAIKNSGEVRIRGVEMDVVYAFESVPGLRVNANYAYAASEFTKGTDVNEGRLLDVADDHITNCSQLGGGTVDGQACDTVDYNGLPGSIVGRALPNAPKQMANLTVSYTTDVSDTWTMSGNIIAAYESKKYVQLHNLAWVDARTLVNANFTLESEDFRFSLWGRNLTDDDTPTAVTRFASPSASFQRNFLASPRTGRQYGVTGTYMF